jgi:uncharacterized protein (TIGR02757 family)
LQKQKALKKRLSKLYIEYNNREFIQYDPIKYVYGFEDRQEREIVGLLCSALSFGRVTQIFKAIEALLEIVHYKPLRYVSTLKKEPDEKLLSFRYRFVTGLDVFHLLLSTKTIIEQYGSIGDFARENYKKGRFLEFVSEIIKAFQDVYYLIPSSLKNSPCKRLFMFFRWMVRDDNIDLGLWKFINPQELVIPLDTHIFRVSKELGLTQKRTASLNTAIEITDNLKKFSESDPVKYDWALSHTGIIKNNFEAKL